MKNSLALILMVAAIMSCGPATGPVEQPFQVTATIDSTFHGTAFLKKRESGKWITLDSADIENRAFSFSGKIGVPERYYIHIPATNSFIPFFAEASDISVNIKVRDINNSLITGSGSQQVYESYLNELSSYDERIRKTYEKFREVNASGDSLFASGLQRSLNDLHEEKSDFVYAYILENNASPVAPYIAYRNIHQWEADQLEEIVAGMDASLGRSVYTQSLKDRIDVLHHVAVGRPYIPFRQKDTAGNMLAVEDIRRGRYLLIDFWASWCGPCREENPNLVEAYETYKNKGFEILGVSLDNNREKWLQAIEEDQLTWHHVSDLKGWKNEASDKYGVIAIPSNVLIDPGGTIIARNLRGEELQAKLKEIFED